MKNINVIACALIGLVLSVEVLASPLCSVSFTDPPSGNQMPNGIVPSSDILNNKLGDLDCYTSGGSYECLEGGVVRSNNFAPGDYSYNAGLFQNGSKLTTNGQTTRLYFDSLQLINSELNLGGAAENLFIYVAGSLQLAGLTKINGLIYVAGSVQVTGNAEISGGIASGGAISLSGNSTVTVDANAIDNAEMNELCQNSKTLQCFNDDFSATQLSDLWVTSTSKGTFNPSIQSGRLRFTIAVQDQATSSTYQRFFPAADNLVEVEFDHFAYDGTGADGIAIVLSDGLVTPSAGAFGGPLGYGFKPNEPGFAGGWLGIGIDEYGNFSNEGGQGAEPGRRRQSVALRGSGVDETGYRYLAGACNNGQTNQNGNCLSPTVDDNNSGSVHRYRITVDSRVVGESQVEILRKIGSGTWQTIVGPINVLDAQYNQEAVPADFLLSVTGSTGSVTNIHEIDNFEVCALKSRSVTDQIDHFRLTHSGQELTCNAESVTVQACLDASCSQLYTGAVTANLLPSSVSGGGGWVGGSGVSFSGGSGTFDVRKNQAGTLTLGVSGSTPPAKPFSTNLCNTGSGWSENNCDLTFSDSGFVLEVPDQIANQAVTATIKAVKQSDNSQQCVPSFASVSKNLDFWSSYLDPLSNEIIGTPQVLIESSAIGASEAAATSRSITFNSSGESSFSVNYPDAGFMQLNARYSGTGDEQGLEMVGSDNFVSFPKYLSLTAENASGTDGACATADISCNVFAAAGESFNLKLTAYGEGDGVTPNYKHSSLAISHSLIEPSGGSVGSLGVSTYNQIPQTGGTNNIAQTISEVGVFDFTVTPPSTFNGSTTFTIPAASTGNSGRFIPSYFNATVGTPILSAKCVTFTYIGESFEYSTNPAVTLNPVAEDGVALQNYLDVNWWRYSNPWSTRAYATASSNSLTMTYDGTSSSVDRVNTLTSIIELNGDVMTYVKPSVAVVPFTAGYSLTLNDTDLTDSDGVCFKSSNSGSCLGLSFDNVDSMMELRWGRLSINDSYGSELSALRQTLELQYYSANQAFDTNTADNCTNFADVNNFTMTSTDYTVVTSGSPTPPQVNASLPSTTASNGETYIEFSAPGSGSTGKITTSFNMETHSLPWLKQDEDNNGTFEDSTSGLVQFGLYRGSDRVIWWNELDQ
ncbi:DUF6701 domain-containing protein [Vibrio ostreicida]|uniref:DUF6701 domain-containing protein n=1 Tax=Vibrio ostreicida TaxID=526588 RepID=UPI001FEB0EF8|nr:DUF6701 domain-containing protein [Vibrio ostreicida]